MAKTIPMLNYLTNPHGELDAKARRTFAGMAHFEGTGPDNMTCRQCAFWGNANGVDRYAASGGMRAHALKPGKCRRFTELMQRPGAGVPHQARACSHFKENPAPPAIVHVPVAAK